jgi:hypothetical protein
MDSKVVETLLKKAASAAQAPEAVNFAQAACNAANALRVLAEIERNAKAPQN